MEPKFQKGQRVRHPEIAGITEGKIIQTQPSYRIISDSGTKYNFYESDLELCSYVYKVDLNDVKFKATHDSVNHPPHYTSDPSGIECIQVTRYRNFNIGNAIKYLWRQGLKDEVGRDTTDKQIEDLKKAIWYINDEIVRISNKN